MSTASKTETKHIMTTEGPFVVPSIIYGRLINALTWMTEDMIAHHKMDNPDKDGDYSRELQDAIDLLETLKKGLE